MKRFIRKETDLPTVALLFGGMGKEHAVSVAGAENLISLIDRRRFRILPVLITESGRWLIGRECDSSPAKMDAEARKSEKKSRNSSEKRDTGSPKGENPSLTAVLPTAERGGGLKTDSGFIRLDLVIPLIHGNLGEDGTIAGLLGGFGIPFIGSGVTAGAVAGDKILTKMIAERLGITTAPWCFGQGASDKEAARARAESEFGYPMFIKPAHLGSSIGVSRVNNPDEFSAAYDTATSLDERVLIEKALSVECEIECGLAELGGRKELTKIGEIRTRGGFYDFETKYSGDGRAEVIFPSPLDSDYGDAARRAAKMLTDAIGLSGISRIDFLLTADGELYFNEINTIPGFTKSSLYPKMLSSIGLTPRAFISRLLSENITKNDRRL